MTLFGRWGLGFTYLRPHQFSKTADELWRGVDAEFERLRVDDLPDLVPEGGFQALGGDWGFSFCDFTGRDFESSGRVRGCWLAGCLDGWMDRPLRGPELRLREESSARPLVGWGLYKITDSGLSHLGGEGL